MNALTTPIDLNAKLNGPVTLMFFLGFIIGSALAMGTRAPGLSPERPQHSALPHQIAKYNGGISLRFAMVHDVIHERFPKHGNAYYQFRNNGVNQTLAKMRSSDSATTRPASDPYWALLDDLAVGHVHLGEFDKAINRMQLKLTEQQRSGISGRDLYSTYANLGTAMMISALQRMATDPQSAKPQLTESLKLVRQSIAFNPEAHFGREIWQVKLGEFILAASDDPQLLTRQDMIGDLFDSPDASPPFNYRPARALLTARIRIKAALDETQLSEQERAQLRMAITHVGFESTSSRRPIEFSVPFDEPTLGIIGMWRYGAGANAHFAICLGEIMLRVGQRYMAWDAFERAKMLAAAISSDRRIVTAFVAHCDKRQTEIEDALEFKYSAKLRAAFTRELRVGENYQHAYQEYEARKLGAGGSIEDPKFYDDYNRTHAPIASDPGHADEIQVVAGGRIPSNSLSTAFPTGMLMGGAFAFITAWGIRRRRCQVIARNPVGPTIMHLPPPPAGGPARRRIAN